MLNNMKISGYPGEVNSNSFALYKQYEMNGSVYTSGDYNLIYSIDTSKGQSGSPIIAPDNTVVGVHTRGGTAFNSGVRITSSMLYYLNEFIAKYS